MIINGPLVYLRSVVILMAIFTLLFRLSDSKLQQTTEFFCDILDLIINFYFIIEGSLRLFTIPALLEIRKRYLSTQQTSQNTTHSNTSPHIHQTATHPPTESPTQSLTQNNSLTYEILRCGWIEILISFLSIVISSVYDSTNAICWFNLFRLSFIANFYILELPQIEVLLVSLKRGEVFFFFCCSVVLFYSSLLLSPALVVVFLVYPLIFFSFLSSLCLVSLLCCLLLCCLVCCGVVCCCV